MSKEKLKQAVRKYYDIVNSLREEINGTSKERISLPEHDEDFDFEKCMKGAAESESKVDALIRENIKEMQDAKTAAYEEYYKVNGVCKIDKLKEELEEIEEDLWYLLHEVDRKIGTFRAIVEWTDSDTSIPTMMSIMEKLVANVPTMGNELTLFVYDSSSKAKELFSEYEYLCLKIDKLNKEYKIKD